MAKRDLLSDLIAIKQRSGIRGGRIPDWVDLQEVKDVWEKWSGPKEPIAHLLPARLVTLIEVFSRSWVQKLINHGTPYDERATELKVDVKFDLALVRSLHTQAISLGLLLSNSVPLNSVASIASVFTTLLHRDFFEWLAQVRGRFWMEKKGKKARPILLDIETHKRSLARLFEVRNILVHEFPEKLPFILSEIDHLMETTSAFMNAADDGFTALLYGPYHHLSQHDMTMAARKESTAVEKALKKLVNEVAQATDTDTMKKAHDAWRAFAKADAERHAAPWTGGTAHPMMYWIAYRVLASDRLRQLQEWYGHFKDDMEMGRRLTPTSA
jgi:uncharacterized protein YecT (DUF1311 family)